MNNAYHLARLLLIGIAIVSLTSCTLRLSPIDARVKEGDDRTDIVEVILSSDDAKAIKQRELYFWIVVVDCESHKSRSHIEPYIAGKPASNFDFSVASEFVTVQGSMPKNSLADLSRPCVVLEGGSYILGQLESTSIPLARHAKRGG